MDYLLRYSLILICFSSILLFGQQFSRQDSLRGGLRPERTQYDLTDVHLSLKILPEKKHIEGYCRLKWNYTSGIRADKIQLDLFAQYHVDSIISAHRPVNYKRDGNVLWINRPEADSIRIYYHGKPPKARNAPWDGGFVWTKDANRKPWIGVACEGLGASSWWPLKDHLSDEPDRMTLSISIPDSLSCITNGQFLGKQRLDNGFECWNYEITCPINSYNVTLNIGDYANFTEVYSSKFQGPLTLKYHVKPYHLEKARAYFRTETPKMLDAFEHYFGPYPCYADGFGLIETPYWGMEHQGAIAYGNQFKKLKPWDFDFILVHESGHEWWGNSISCTDHAEMWIHEGFTTYSESLYLEYHQGYKTAMNYLAIQKQNIENTVPLLGPMGVNYQGWNNNDIYYKGAWFLNTLRHTFPSDSMWFDWLKKFAIENRHSFQTTASIQASMEKHAGYALNSVFEQYLRTNSIPILRFNQDSNGNLQSHWENCHPDFQMPVFLLQGKSPKVRVDPQGIKPGSIKYSNRLKKELESRYLIEVVFNEKQ